MKKMLALSLFLFSVMLSGCDTTDTTTIAINLGGSRAAPADVSKVFIAVFTENIDGRTSTIDEFVMAAAAVPAGALSVVVPAGRELYIMVMAVNSSGTLLYLGENEYPGESDPALANGSVNITMDSISLPVFTMDPTTEDYQNITIRQEFSEFIPTTMRQFMEMQVLMSSLSSTGPYSVIHSESYATFYSSYYGYDTTYHLTFDYDLGTEMPVPSTYWFYSRLYIPFFGLSIPAGSIDSVTRLGQVLVGK